MGGASGVIGPGTAFGESAGDSGETGDATCVPAEGPGSASADRPSSCESMPSMKLTKSSKASPPEGSDSMAAGNGAQEENLELKNGCARIDHTRHEKPLQATKRINRCRKEADKPL